MCPAYSVNDVTGLYLITTPLPKGEGRDKEIAAPVRSLFCACNSRTDQGLFQKSFPRRRFDHGEVAARSRRADGRMSCAMERKRFVGQTAQEEF
jgi:hypothetical protein